MQRRPPVIVWLLFAATVSIDVAVYAGFVSEPHAGLWMVTYDALFDALMTGQLSVICIWSVLGATKTFWTRMAPWLAVVLASLVIGLFGFPPLRVGLPSYGLHVALLIAALWILERTAFWRRRSGTIAEWRYSIAHLLMIMTIVAVLAAATRNSDWFAQDGRLNTAIVCASVALAVVSVIAWCFSQSQHVLILFAAVLGFAMLLGAAFLIAEERFMPLYLGTHYLVQAIMLSAWIGIGQILPIPRTTPPTHDG